MTCASSAVFDQVHQVLFNTPHILQYSHQNFSRYIYSTDITVDITIFNMFMMI